MSERQRANVTAGLLRALAGAGLRSRTGLEVNA